ncbi:nicotinate-nicotinamide nucleotide adenylyltransferase [Vibrio sinensis]|uniref:nicotinate-nucleotide adenylyltransferase n=1 Tax=Vibrio sinensis TaxID=2302434 RepID=A0A3A6QID8_9VIBR|nr:nicotinate-nicotinamide nucleotide adenylyltransferase [Vibrio sinensis]RJX69683.1 nicotinate-nicotinamide nucleotide adenylyltransferase [Vibrio sinensis]
MKKIAVFGSAFNPPSLGHKSVLESLLHFDKVLLVPSISHAWGKEMLEYSSRCELVDAFIADLESSTFERCDIEETLFQPNQSVTTYSVMEALQLKYPESELTFVLGPDNFFNFSKFYRAEDILSQWSVMACPEKVNIRSTDIRSALQAQESIDSFTTPRVRSILIKNKHYK